MYNSGEKRWRIEVVMEGRHGGRMHQAKEMACGKKNLEKRYHTEFLKNFMQLSKSGEQNHEEKSEGRLWRSTGARNPPLERDRTLDTWPCGESLHFEGPQSGFTTGKP